MTRIFISYRRDDSADAAGRIYDWLAANFRPENVFIDVDNIPPGVDFREHLAKSVQQCDILLALIGDEWLRDKQGRQRLDDPRDFVRIEIEAALRRKIVVIPVRLHGAKMPGEAELPDALAELAFRNAIEIRHESFRQDLERLVGALKQHDETLAADSGATEKEPLRAAPVANPGTRTPAPPRSGADQAPASSTPQPASASKRRYRTVAAVVGLVAVAGGLVSLAAGIVYWRGNESTTPNGPTAADRSREVKDLAPANVSTTAITSLDNESRLVEAVGVLVSGWEVEEKGRTVIVPSANCTAFAISTKGYLLTTNYALDEQENAQIEELKKAGKARHKFWIAIKDKVYDAQVVHQSSTRDWSIAKVDGQLPFAFRLSRAASIPNRTAVYSLGLYRKNDAAQDNTLYSDIESYIAAWGFELVMTKGIVARTTKDEKGVAWIQHDALMRPGDGGAPLCLESGVVAGVGHHVRDGFSFALMLAPYEQELTEIVDGLEWEP